MNAIELEIRNMAAYVIDTCKRIDNMFANGWLIRSANEYQIAIPFSSEEEYVDEFVGIKMNTGILNVEGEVHRVLYLHVVDSVNMEKFMPIAYQFLQVRFRREILKDPYAWFDEWRDIFGDSIKRKSIFDVLGEMLAFREILKFDKTVKWMGPKSGSQDIVGKDHLYEVKTTTSKKETIVHINSAIQLLGEKPESLILVRLEAKPYASSIDSVEAELVAMGIPEDDIEECLHQKGLTKGSKYRKITYDLIEVLSYNVTKDIFPQITLKQLNENAPLKNIIDYELMLSLDSVPHKTIFSK
ncbi:MAG: PD-(D/E)XK motif protein [Bacilli bacterium]|nr:PD-(D/E)XK motif protein [Bacilli bacterium]